MSDAVPVDLEDLDARCGKILESRIDREGGSEFAPLLVELLPMSILCSYRLHGFLRRMDITQESRSGGGMEILHELCGWG